MGSDPGTLNLSETPSGGQRRVAPPDPVFGKRRTDGTFGLLAHYRVQKQLGCGGMGAVYLAIDEGLDRKVALKVMLPSAAADPAAKERFLREAKTAAAIKHDNVVTIYQVGEDRGIPFIAMEFLSGTPLDGYLSRKGRLTVQQTLRVGIETAEGLGAAHALGLIHRDIKPANLWLEAPRGRIKILDFGIARRLGDGPQMGLTGTGIVVGTPGYMSPEQARGKSLDPRSDLFSLGIVLYELTTGRPPFDGDTALAVLTALAVDDPVPVRRLNPEIPAELETIIHRLLEKNPAARQPSAAVLAAELRAIAEGPVVPVATAVPEMVPQVVYVPITVTAQEELPHEFDGFGDDATEVEPERHRPAAERGRGLWIAAAVAIVLVAVVVAGTILALRKPSPKEPEPNPTPASPPKPTPQKNPPPPKVDSNPAPGTRGLRFAPDGYVGIPGLMLPDEGSFTLEGYVTPDESMKGEGHVFGTKYRCRLVATERPQGLCWEVHASSGGNPCRINGPVATRGKRAHVAVVRSGTELRLYVDGKQVGTVEAAGALAAPGLISFGGEKFAGIIDEVRLSGTARYEGKEFTPPARLDPDKDALALYRFDEGQGLFVKDYSNNNKTAQIFGPKWVNPTEPGPIIVVGPQNPLTPDEFNQLLSKHLLSHVSGLKVSEKELSQLRAMQGIASLKLSPLDDMALEKLSEFPWAPDIFELHIYGPKISNAGFAHVAKFQRIQVLILGGTQVNDDGLKPLSSLPRLQWVGLYGSKVTDKAAAQLAALKTVTTIDLSYTSFGDEGLKGLAPMTGLEYLFLQDTPVTDAGVDLLQNRMRLRQVVLKGTKATPAAIKRLRDSLPKGSIVIAE